MALLSLPKGPRLTSPGPSPTVAGAVVWLLLTSQSKPYIFPSVPAEFTCARVRMTIGPPRSLPGYPTAPAFYPVPVHRVRVLPSASFRFHLTVDTLA